MLDQYDGRQTIGCSVTSCAHNKDGCGCRLSKIEVEPMQGSHSGEACDESLCGSYRCSK